MAMAESSAERTEYLLTWVGSLSIFSKTRQRPNIDDFKDGVLVGKILRDVIDPKSFGDLSDSSVLVQVVEKMKKYLQAGTAGEIPSNSLPNAGKILSSGDTREIEKLLQLLAACAFTSPRKDTFVQQIIEMEESVQRVIMQVITDLVNSGEPKASSPGELQMSLTSGLGEIRALQDVVDDLQQQNYELKSRISYMTDECSTLVNEKKDLTAQLQSLMQGPTKSMEFAAKSDEAKKEIEALNTRNEVLESQLHDERIKLQVSQQKSAEAYAKLASYSNLAEEHTRLKDEMDILREAAGKIGQYEASIQKYKNRLEEMEVYKSNLKDSLEKVEELSRAKVNLEEELRKSSGLKSQVDAVKKELAEIQQRLSHESQRAIKAEFDGRTYREKFESAQENLTKVTEQKNKLVEELDELRLGVPIMSDIVDGNRDYSIELLPTFAREKIIRLEHENKILSEKLTASVEELSAEEGPRVLVEQLRKHEEELETQLLTKSQEFEDYKLSAEEKIRSLEAQVEEKNDELAKKKLQYEKCIEKAKSVVNTLEPTAPGGINFAKGDGEKEKAIREREEKLIQSIFYGKSMELHRNAVENRNSTFLQRHRHPPNAPRRKSDM